MSNKAGSWSDEEKAFLRDNAAAMTPEEIAARLRRNVKTVRRYLERNPQAAPKDVEREAEKTQIRGGLRDSLGWAKLRDEFTPDELEYFEEEYAELMAQFKEDVLKTEEQQVRKAITLDILMRRNLVDRRRAREDIGRLGKMQGNAAARYEREKDGLTQDERRVREEHLLNIESQLQAARAAEQSKTREYADLDNRHQRLMEALKATREQRISRVENSKQSWLGLLRDLADEERREEEGRAVRLAQEATRREHQKLAGQHKYDDGTFDQPILSAETVEMLDRAEEEASAAADEEE